MKWFSHKQSLQRSVFSHWIEQYHGPLYKHALWMTGNRELAMDMVQEAYYQAWSSIATLKDEAKVFAWLMTILQRAVYREQRHQYRHKETLEALCQEDASTSEAYEYSLAESYRVMESISPVQRETFLLYELHGFSYEEISQQLNVPIGTVMSRIARARDALKMIHSQEVDHNIIKLQEVKRGER